MPEVMVEKDRAGEVAGLHMASLFQFLVFLVGV